MVNRFPSFFVLLFLLAMTGSCVSQNQKGEEETIAAPKQMELNTLHFQAWNAEYPLEVSKTDHSAGFFQVGKVTFRNHRPSVELLEQEGHLSAHAASGNVLWEGEATVPSAPYDAAKFTIDSFDEVLFVEGSKALVLESDNHLYHQEGDQRLNELLFRGIAQSPNGDFNLAVREGNNLNILVSATNEFKTTLETGPEIEGQGPWTLYGVGTDALLVANHLVMRRYALDGSLVSESSLTDAVYGDELFPNAWYIASLAAEGLNQVVFAVTGPTGMGIVQLKW